MPQSRRDTVFNPDAWRDIAPEDRVVCTLRAPSAFGDFHILRHNGIVALVERIGDGLIAHVHYANIEFPRPERITLRKTSTRLTSKERLIAKIAELLA